MKYVVLTTKHQRGLLYVRLAVHRLQNAPTRRLAAISCVSMWTRSAPRDCVIGFYYSLIDWHHPSSRSTYTYIYCRDDPDAEEQSKGRDMKKYAEYMRNQVTELLTNYGKIDILWFDFSYSGNTNPNKPWMRGKGKDDWEAEELIATARRLQPGIIIDNRTEIEQDLWTPEQYQPTAWVRHAETGEYVTWEACQTFSGSWGYYRDEMTWKSPEMLIQMLINTVAVGGNLLMNVGPTSRGYLDYRAEAALAAYADWMKYNSRSIYGCTMAEPELLALCPNGCKFTQSEDGSRLYIHLYEYPFQYLELQGFAGKVDYAQFLHDGSELLFEENKISHFSEGRTASDNMLVIKLPVVKPKTLVPVIELMLK